MTVTDTPAVEYDIVCEPMGGTPTGAPPAGRAVNVWDSRDLWMAQFPEPRWAVPSLIPEGLTILAGAPKIGKSWLALGIGIGLAHGRELLGAYDAGKPSQVLYLALEDPPRRLQQRLYHLTDTPPCGLSLATSWQQGQDGIADLSQYLETHPDTRLVIVDTWQRFRGTSGRRLDNSYADDYEAVSRLKAVADTYGTAIVMLHHTRKGNGEDGDFLQEVSGTMGISGAADTIIVVRRGRGRAEAELHVTGRDVEEREMALAWKEKAGWQISGDAADYRLSEERADILKVFRSDAREELSPKDICAGLGYAAQGREADSIRQLLGKLVDDGMLRKANYGKYALTTPIHTTHSGHSEQEMGGEGGEL